MAVDTQYDVGDEIPMAFDYAVLNETTGLYEAADPDDLALTIVSPAGGANVAVAYPGSIVRMEEGSFFYGYKASTHGWLRWYWEVDGPIPKVVQAEVYVRRLAGT